MSCRHCISLITRALVEADPACRVDVDPTSKSVQVHGTEDRATLAEALIDAGYPPA